ncbi:MAG: carbon-nitrogen hydrolase family protein [Pikeienuella sp.]
MKIACLQTRPMADFTSALAEALNLAEQAVSSGASFLLLPEYCGGLKGAGAKLTPPAATEEDHPVLAGLRAFAAKHNVWMLIGSIAIAGQAGKIINRGFMIDDTGAIRSRYDKIHMFDIQLSETEVYEESATVSAGNQAVLVDTPLGCVGHSICYDLRFPQLYRDMAQAGAEILVTPAAFTKKTGQAHWHVLNRARAIENGAFVIAPCAVGEVPGGGEAYGHSLIIAPWGEVLADGGPEAGIVLADIDITQVASARQRIPALSHDRDYDLATPSDDTNQRNVA